MRLAVSRKRRAIGLTPMIDVVFLLLVFFMLAANFERETSVQIFSLGSGSYSGPPRLVDVLPSGLRLNSVEVSKSDLEPSLRGLMTSETDTIALRARDGADVQRLTDVLTFLRGAGFRSVALVP